ncbi:MAG: SDR family oxidoreductase [Roseateles sp.]
MPTQLKTAVVTGASSGIGAVYADRLAARGYNLILVARRADRLAALAQRLSEVHGIAVNTMTADLEKEADLARVEAILAHDERIRVLVNNAGVSKVRPLSKTAVGDSLSQIALNVVALTRLTHAALPAFLSRNEGAIINIASVLAIQYLPVSAVYSGTKAYVLAFTRGLQNEVAKTGVKVQLVLPGVTATEIWTEGVSGVPLAMLNKDTVMTAEDMVDAALAGFDQGELVTWPSVADGDLWTKFDAARAELFAATETGRPAPRYLKP